MDAVAARSRAGKATIYRRWPSKAALVADAVAAMQEARPTPDTGSLRDDLVATADAFLSRDDRRDGVLAGLITAMFTDPQLRIVLREALGGPSEDAFAAVIARAADRGLVAAGVDVPLVSSLLPALAFHRVGALGLPVDEPFLLRVVDEVLMPLLVPPAQNPRRAR